jgi:bifunctional DNase/RNase
VSHEIVGEASTETLRAAGRSVGTPKKLREGPTSREAVADTMRQMKVDKLGIDLLTHDPVVILKDLEGKRYLPILIGPFEATAIALALEGQAVPRPLSHDLMKSILDGLNAKLTKIVIHDIKDSTFYAKLVLESSGEDQEIDARPSDCIALALRTNAPIYVSDKIVLEESVYDKKAEEEEMQRFRKYIENLKPSDFKES